MPVEDAYQRYRETRFFGSLNGIRFLCIMMVLWHHSSALGTFEDPVRIVTRGFAGVDFFFVLSGYLITTLLLREEARDGRFSLLGFYRRRFLRIVPIYFLVVTSVGVWWILVRGQDQWWPYMPYYYLFLANFLEGDIPLLGPMWSLSVEEQYYVLWPGLLLLLPAVARFRVGLLVVLIAAAIFVDIGLIPRWMPIPANDVATIALPPSGFSAILIGSLMAVLLHMRSGFAAAWGVLGHRMAPAVLFAVLILLWQGLPVVLWGWPNLVMHVTMALLLASVVMREDHVLSPVLGFRPVARIGEISYGLYLWHLVGLHFGVTWIAALGVTGDLAAWMSLPVYIVLSILIAEASYRYFESYFLGLKSRPRRSKPSPA